MCSTCGKTCDREGHVFHEGLTTCDREGLAKGTTFYFIDHFILLDHIKIFLDGNDFSNKFHICGSLGQTVYFKYTFIIDSSNLLVCKNTRIMKKMPKALSSDCPKYEKNIKLSFKIKKSSKSSPMTNFSLIYCQKISIIFPCCSS